jgi:hypothetical protein
MKRGKNREFLVTIFLVLAVASLFSFMSDTSITGYQIIGGGGSPPLTQLPPTVFNPYPTNGLVFHIPMEESLDFSDVSGNGNDGTCSGSQCPKATFGVGPNSIGYNFDGVQDILTIPDSPSIDTITQDLTIAFWMNLDNVPGFNQKIIVEANRYDIGRNGVGNLIFTTSTTSGVKSVIGGDPTPYIGVWTHMVGTYDGSNIRLYINGDLVAVKAQTGTFAVVNKPITIGAKIGAINIVDHYDGQIDDVAVWNRALTTKEIKDLFRYHPTPSRPLSKGKISSNCITLPDGKCWDKNLANPFTNKILNTAYETLTTEEKALCDEISQNLYGTNC